MDLLVLLVLLLLKKILGSSTPSVMAGKGESCLACWSTHLPTQDLVFVQNGVLMPFLDRQLRRSVQETEIAMCFRCHVVSCHGFLNIYTLLLGIHMLDLHD